jgi:hypothetical protein
MCLVSLGSKLLHVLYEMRAGVSMHRLEDMDNTIASEQAGGVGGEEEDAQNDTPDASYEESVNGDDVSNPCD